MGLGVPTSKTQVGVCHDPKTVVRAGNRHINVPRIAPNCTCTLESGKKANYPDGTPCFGKDDKKRGIGNCSSGVCQLAQSTYGCAGKNGTEQGSTINNVMCTFECEKEGGGKEWGYLPDGFPCVNKDEVEGKNGTCKHRPHRDGPNETVCFPNDQMHLLGC
uniref:Putative disintigrin n=1 Tax=Amblyomma cajennense TaxID=34607 RepID=A0A023FPJ6_AMBCJ